MLRRGVAAMLVAHGRIRLLGIGRLLAIATFIAGAIGLLHEHTWWYPVLWLSTLTSLALCLVAWSEARLGVLFDVVILVALLIEILVREHSKAHRSGAHLS